MEVPGRIFNTQKLKIWKLMHLSGQRGKSASSVPERNRSAQRGQKGATFTSTQNATGGPGTEGLGGCSKIWDGYVSAEESKVVTAWAMNQVQTWPQLHAYLQCLGSLKHSHKLESFTSINYPRELFIPHLSLQGEWDHSWALILFFHRNVPKPRPYLNRTTFNSEIPRGIRKQFSEISNQEPLLIRSSTILPKEMCFKPVAGSFLRSLLGISGPSKC